MNQSLGGRLKTLRDGLGIKQEDLAKLMGIDRTSLSQIENNKRPLKAEELVQLSKIFNLTTDQLLDLEPLPDIHLESSKEELSREKASTRINVPAKNIRKFKEVLLYVLSKIGAKPNIGETVICKLLYFIDFNYYEKYEEQLTGATYIKNHHGPTPREFIEIVKDMIGKKELELVKSEHFQFKQKKYLPLREPNLSFLNAREIKLIDEVLDKLSNMNAATISEYSHKDIPWVVTPQNKPIDYETVFYRTAPYSVREYNDEDFR
jgi:transcriptional regulator with XRE-family HTH domain